MRTGESLRQTAKTETADPGMNENTDTKETTGPPIGQTIDPPYLSTMVETTGMHAPLVGIATSEVASPGNPPVPTPRRKKASEYRELGRPSPVQFILTYSRRISPRSADISVSSRTQSPAVTRDAQPDLQKEPEPEVEFEISTTPPPVETTLAARRAKRLAILAKYGNQPTPVPSNTGTPLSGTSSAVPPPPSTVSVSDNLSQLNRAEPPTPLSTTNPPFDRKSSSPSLFP